MDGCFKSLPLPSCRVRSRSLVQAASAAETAGGGSVVLGMTSWDAGWNMLGYFSGTLWSSNIAMENLH
jgi:hypothetical protein